MTPQIRTIEESDYDPIILVLDDWWGGRQMASMLPRLFFKHFAETSFIAGFRNEKIGFLIGLLSSTHALEAYIHFVGIHPDYRMIGIGRSLYQCFFDIINKHGRKLVRCVTSPGNASSISFHQHMGFQIEPDAGEYIHKNYDGPGEDRILFFKEITN